MNFKSWLLISEMAKPSIEYLETNSLQALSEIERNPVLKTRYKFLISEWDTKKNILTPSNVTPGSEKEINWKCIKKKHTWSAPLYSRTRGNNCPCCSNFIACKDNNLQYLSKTLPESDLKARYKRLVSEWDKENNVLTAKDVLPGSRQEINWKCKEGHLWVAPIRNRTTLGSNCPDCSSTNKRVTKDYNLQALSEKLPESDLKARYKFLVSEWDKENNILTPSDVTPGSDKEINWKCIKKKHTWSAPLSNRTKGHNCPCCSNQEVCKDNNLQALSKTLPESDLKARYKRLVSEWDKENNVLTAKDVTPGSGIEINWKCKEGHLWVAPLSRRTGVEANCPTCNQSKGEEKTYEILQNYINSTQIKRQHQDADCRGDCLPLRFDFIVETNRKKYFIEYNGQQHYRPVFGSTPEERKSIFEKAQRYDKVKLEYCRSKNIPFLVIPYTQYKNIGTIISSFLKTKTFDSKFAELRL